jgi:hypothetical protein
MRTTPEEHRLQTVAQRYGLKIVLDRYSASATGRKEYFLRPIWNARRGVRVLPSGSYELVYIAKGRRRAASLLPLDDLEQLLHRLSKLKSCAPARLPWEAGVVAQSIALP